MLVGPILRFRDTKGGGSIVNKNTRETPFPLDSSPRGCAIREKSISAVGGGITTRAYRGEGASRERVDQEWLWGKKIVRREKVK